jgi:hypothetical protein
VCASLTGMPWPRKPTIDALKLQRENDGLRTAIVCLKRELENKQGHLSKLEYLLHERLTKIDELNGQLKNKQLQLVAAPQRDANASQ